MINTINLWDCLEIMKKIPDGSIDAIITDPPYGTTACKWDSVIPFDLMWAELKRIIKPNGAIVLFGSEPFSSVLRMSNIKEYKYDWIWEKTIVWWFVNAKNKPLNTFEKIHIFSDWTCANWSDNKMCYFPQWLIEINKIRDWRRSCNDEHRLKRKSHKENHLQQFTNYPKNILKFWSQWNTVHPTQKPVALLEYLIKTYTNEWETVLDFTAGSGTTWVACQNTNRNYILIEKDSDYCEIIKKRLASTTPPLL